MNFFTTGFDCQRDFVRCTLEDKTFLSYMNAVIEHAYHVPSQSEARSSFVVGRMYRPFAVLIYAIIFLDEAGG